MNKVTIKINEDTHKQLINLVSKKQMKVGKRVSIDEIIKELIKCYIQKQ